MNRRRFIAITAAAAMPIPTQASTRWRGVALGAEAEITLRGVGGEAAMADALDVLQRAEAEFSLYREDSALSKLNRQGLLAPSPVFRSLASLCDRLHQETEGFFDPTVQTLWKALATGGNAKVAEAAVDWSRVSLSDVIRLGAGQSLTFNGVAQGYAADLVSEALQRAGFAETLVNIGEFRAGADAWRVGVAAPDGDLLDVVELSGEAIATSSPAATMVGGRSHILSSTGRQPRWSTVSVKAPSAALADGLSTALCLADEAEMMRIAGRFPEAKIRRWA